MSQKKLDFYCIGAAHMDIKARAESKPELGESIPARSSTCFGGVARNVAENLCKMGANVALCSRIGNDPYGHSLLKALAKAGIDISEISFSSYKATATYYALLNEIGELFIAIVDMAIYAELTPALISSGLGRHASVANWVIDANLSEQTIKAIAEHKAPGQSLWGVGVAAFNAARLEAGFPHFSGLFLNKKELLVLSGYQDICKGIKALLKRGCSLVIVSAGSEGVYYAFNDRIFVEECHPSRVVDVTGAGDALCATILFGLFKGEELASVVKRGIVSAAHIISSLNSSLHT